jgi:lysozyme family protein
MSAATLAAALQFTLREEGGYVNNPADHGGATNHGITQTTYDVWRDNLKQPRQRVQSISDAEVQGIYNLMYWAPGHCDRLSPALSICQFDWCVNHGAKGATITLQQALNVTADGAFGPGTAAALAAQDHGIFWQSYNDLRRNWYRAWVRAHPDQGQFLKGWLARVDRLDAFVGSLR